MNSLIFHLKEPAYLMGFFILPFLILVFLGNQRYSLIKLRKFGEDALISRITPDNSKAKQYLKFIFLILALSCIIVQLSSPIISYRKRIKFPADMFFLVDVSNSMMAEDIVPNRLEFAKEFLLNHIDSYPDCRIGLIPFAGSSVVEVPLTRNYPLLKEHIKALNIHSVPVQGTLISQALKLSISSFSNRNDRAKIVLLLTDGENHEPQMEILEKEFRARNIHLLILGMGTLQGAKIPEIQKNKPDFLRDKDGNWVITRLNPNLLEEMAILSGGRFLPIHQEAKSLDLYLDNYINQSRQGIYEQIQESRIPIFLLGSFFFLILEFILFERKNRAWKITISKLSPPKAVMVFIILFFYAPDSKAQFSSVGNAEKAYYSGNYKLAVDLYKQIIKEKNLDNSGIWTYNLACSEFRMGEFKTADSLFMEVLNEKNISPEIKKSAWFNAGNASFNQGNYLQSIQKYIQYLRLNPKDKDAWYNLAFARWKLKKDQKSPPPPPPNPEQEKQKKRQGQSQAKNSPSPHKKSPVPQTKKGSGNGTFQNLEKNW